MSWPTDAPAVGSLVKLRAGGPVLVVTRVDHAGIECTWFQTDEFKSKTFPAAALQPYLDDPPG